jgi:hypothetical protein
MSKEAEEPKEKYFFFTLYFNPAKKSAYTTKSNEPS